MKRAFRGISSFLRESLQQKAQKSQNYAQSPRLLSSKAALDGDACTIEDGGNPISGNPKFENRRIRRNLALAYRLLNRLELNEGVCNHLTAMAPCRDSSSEETMLVIPGHLPNGGASQHWAEVTASSLIGVDGEGNVIEPGNVGGYPELSAKCIHLGIRKIRPNAKVIMHTHSDYVTALSCLKDPHILPIHQSSMRFVERVAYYQQYDVPDVIDEGKKLGEALEDKDILIMGQHGVLVVAPTVHQAFDEIYYLERACKIQLLASQAVGGDKEKLSLMTDEGLYKSVTSSYTDEVIDTYSKRHFYSYWDMYLRNEPDVFS